MNTASTPRGLMPSVRRIAMSVRLSLTTITRVATMLNTATATISIRINPIMVFSMLMARKYASFSCVQSRSSSPGGKRDAAARASSGARSTSSNFRRIPVGPDKPRNASASLRLMSASTLSCSCNPDLEDPHHLEFLQPRHDGRRRPRCPES